MRGPGFPKRGARVVQAFLRALLFLRDHRKGLRKMRQFFPRGGMVNGHANPSPIKALVLWQ